ncbi:hypothetical protein [Acidovorax sp.]|uniref:hypothetical protein n=1 Tax=Acidovorax sp. TaxID=1872122 RepID=UPI004037CC35
MSWLPGASDLGLSITTGAALAAVLTVVAWGLALRLRGRWLPVQYLVRVLCVVQALALLYFWFAPMPFPHLVLNHVMDLLDSGYLLILAIPVLMALGYYPLQISWQAKVVHTCLSCCSLGSWCRSKPWCTCWFCSTCRWYSCPCCTCVSGRFST